MYIYNISSVSITDVNYTYPNFPAGETLKINFILTNKLPSNDWSDGTISYIPYITQMVNF